MEEVRVLADHPDRLAQRVLGDRPDVVTVDRDRTRRDGVQPGHERGHRRVRSGRAFELPVTVIHLAAGSPPLRTLFQRIDAELAHGELKAPWTWLLEHGPCSVAVLRKATGASKPELDRLVMAGPVSRTLGEQAEIRITCGVYERRCR